MGGVPVRVDPAAIELPDGPAVVAFITDRREQMAAEEALRASERRSRLLIEQASDAIFSGPQVAANLVSARPDIGVLYASGYTEEAALQVNVRDPGIAFLAKPYTMDGLLQHVGDALDDMTRRRAS